MHKSPSPLSEEVRGKIAATLNERLADGLDLHSQIKVAHWNIKGPQFAALHPLFETFAVSLAAHNDAIAGAAATPAARRAQPGARGARGAAAPTARFATSRRPRSCRSTRRRRPATWST